MATVKTDKIGVTGGVTQLKVSRKTPKLHIFGVSFNSAKAHLALRISSAWHGTEIRMMDILGTNYRPDYVRLNPAMTVPTLEIDDKLFSDSDLLAEYLLRNHPGAGDRQALTAGREADLQQVCELVKRWDEGMYTYGRMSGEKGGGMGAMSNLLRKVRLRQNFLRLSAPSEKLWDGRTIQEAYTDKIVYIDDLSSKVDVGATPEKKAAFEKNERLMDELFTKASSLIDAAGGNGFLLGPALTTADAYFAPLLFRVAEMDKKELEATFQKYPTLRGYWERFCQSAEGQQSVTQFTMKWAFRFAAARCLPCAMLGLKLGIIKVPALPADVEEKIRKRSSC